MQDLPTEILSQLGEVKDGDKWTNSQDLARKLGCDYQKIFGAIMSLESLGGYIDTRMVAMKRWALSSEGQQVKEEGSHEARVYNNVPGEGVEQSELLKRVGGLAKVGLGKALSAGWLELDKSGGVPRVRRKVDHVTDTVKDHMALIQDGLADQVPDKVKTDYKKRKLVEEITEKVYEIKRGPNFSTTIKKVPTDITPEMIQTGSWRQTNFKPYNLNSLGVEPSAGHLHPLLKVRAEYRQIFLEMGFTEMPTNNYMESSFWNFDALFQPQQHPARDAHDTFFISDPAKTEHFPGEYLERVKQVHSSGGFGSQGYGYDWKLEEASKNLLRTHTTAVSARMLYKLARQKEGFTPAKYFSIDRVFRNETLDATHLAEFHQIEGVIADRGLTLGDLIGVLYQFFTKLGIEKLRFKPAYNPYTEPSMEIFSYHEGLGKWVEIGNSGIFRPEMLLPMGLPSDVNVIAWGLSLERPTMIKYKIDNIRDLVGHKVNLGMVHTNPICRLDKPNTPEERQFSVINNRWDKITDRLEILQKRVELLTGKHLNSINNTLTQTSKLPELVVHTSIPPYSISLLISLLPSHLKVHTSSHIHSTFTTPAPSIVLPTSNVTRSEADIKLTVIFTSIADTKCVVTPGRELRGEVNILRYMTRVIPGMEHLYEAADNVCIIDMVLDNLSVAATKHQVMKVMTTALESSSSGYLAGGSKMSIADLLGLSLAHLHSVSTPLVKKWRDGLLKEGIKL